MMPNDWERQQLAEELAKQERDARLAAERERLRDIQREREQR